jgi:NAD(P)H-dependent nitrite reductase small subunit
MDSEAPTRRQVVKFSFFKISPLWRLQPAAKREAHKQSIIAAVDAFADRLQVRSYSVVGMRGDTDFLLWQIGERLDDIQALHSALLGTPMGPYLSLPHSFLAMTRRSQYVSPEEGSARLHLHPADSKYFFVYPFVKTREWYQLPQEERQAMMDEHIRVGRKYPSVKLNTTYSFGLDDQEFVVSFETDEPADFLDLVMELREAKTSLYTLRDTPIFTCISMSLADTLNSLGTTIEAAITEPALEPEWTRVASTSDVPEGGARLVYVAGEQVALFRAGERFYALANRCPHANGPLADGTIMHDTGRPSVACPLHESRFDLETGEPLRGPTNRPAKAYEVRVDADDVLIRAS